MSKIRTFDMHKFLPYLLNQASEKSGLAFERHYKARYGMLRAEWRVMFHLGSFGSLSATDITFRALMHKTKISRAVRALELKGFLKRARQKLDRRSETLQLTALGFRAFEKLRIVAGEFDKEICKGLPEADLMVLRKCLSKLAKN
jgi:DNA-binding MarR family transcriptional regulator